MDKATYSVFVDWDNGPGQNPPVAPFIGSDDDISAYVLSMDWTNGNDSGESGNIRAGSCTIKLDNSTSIFSSYNAASILYGRILPGLRVKIVMTIGAGAPVVMWQGFLDSIVPTVGAVIGISTTTLQADGILAQFPADSDIDIAMQTDIKTGDAIDLILDAANVPAIDRAIQTGQSTLSRFWARKGRTLDLLRELETAETGLIRETKDGKISFEDRSLRLGLYVRSTYGTGVLNLWDPQQDNSLLNIYNSIQARVRTFNVSDSVTLATVIDVANALGGAAIPIANAEVKIIDIDFPTPSSPAEYLAVSSWGIVDLNINTAADGSGTDLTNTSITLARQELGRKLRITITNGSGSAGYLILLRAHGVAVVEGDPLTVMAEDLTSQGKYRKRAYPNPSQWLTQLSEGQAYCNHNIALYKDPRPAIRHTIKANYDSTHLLEAQTIDISDRIHMTLSLETFGLAIDEDMFVEWMSHSVDEAKLHNVKVFARKAVTHTWTASGAAYSPKTIYGPGTSKPPDDLSCAAIATGRDILFGVAVWKWNDTIDQAEFRARLLASTALNRDNSRIYAVIETQNGYSIPATGSLSFWVMPLEGFYEVWHTPGGLVPDISASWLLCTATGENQGSPRQTQPLDVFGIQGLDGGGIRAGWVHNGSDKMAYSSIGMPIGQWSMVTVTWANGGDTKVYINAQLSGTTSGLNATFDTSAYNLSILSGLEPQTHSFGGLFGRANWLGIWNKVLSSDEIAYLLEETPDKVAIPNLQDAWSMTTRPDIQSGWSHEDSSVNPSVHMMANNYVSLNSGPVGFNVPAAAGGHEYVDLRTPEEDGTLGIDGCPYIIATGILAYFWGAHYKSLNNYEGTWWYAFRLRNSSGWSVWSDGNDTPSRVTDHATTSTIQDTGPPQDWTVWAEPDPSGAHAVVVKGTRPQANGASIWKVWFQIRDISGGEPWRNIDDGVGASVVYYNGQSASPATWEDFTIAFNSSHFTKVNPGFQNGKLGVVAIFDQHMVNPFSHSNCAWTMPVDFENNDPATAHWFGIGIPLEDDASSIHLKMIKPIWDWNTEGYFGNEPGRGFDDKGLDPFPLKDPVTGEYGDTTSQVFVSDPIPVPADVPLDHIGARIFYQNGWSTDDDDTYFAPDPTYGIGSGYEIVLTDAATIVSNATQSDTTPRKLFFCQLLDSVGPTRVLGCPTGAKHRQPMIYIIRQSAMGTLNYTMDAKHRLGNDVPWSPSSGPNKQDYVGIMYDANDDKYDVISFVRGY